MKPKRLTAIVPLLVSLLIPAAATSAPAVKEVEVNGVVLPYEEEGSGEAIVFIHGGLSGPAMWGPVRAATGKKYRSISYTQRYYGSAPWPDDGTNFNLATLADDLAKLIQSLNAGPAHLVGWSYGGAVAAIAALKNPSMVRSLILYEPALGSVLPADSPEGKTAREDRAKIFGPATTVAKAGDAAQAARLLYEAIYQLPPGSFEGLPQSTKARVLENARTLPLLAAAPPPNVACDDLKAFTRPTLVMRGEKSQAYFALTSEGVANCVPGAQRVVMQNVNHNGPVRDPDAFSAAVLEFLAKRQGF
jgi:pimeloyl-ACP methyl ester carboxylesterase